jgi:hypothetical protein
VITGYGEAIKPYLVATLTSVGCVVAEDVVLKTPEPTWETPNVRVEMLPDTYDGDNWTTCHARITAILETADKEQALERSNNLLALVARKILFNTEFGLPEVGGNYPVWLPGATIRGSRPEVDAMDFMNIKLVWECDFPTPCGGI